MRRASERVAQQCTGEKKSTTETAVKKILLLVHYCVITRGKKMVHESRNEFHVRCVRAIVTAALDVFSSCGHASSGVGGTVVNRTRLFVISLSDRIFSSFNRFQDDRKNALASHRVTVVLQKEYVESTFSSIINHITHNIILHVL